VVAAGRAVSAHVAQRGSHDHRVSHQRPGPVGVASRRVPDDPLCALGIGAAAAGASSRVRVAVLDLGARGDGPDGVRVGRVRESARRGPPQARVAGPAAGNGSARRRAGRSGPRRRRAWRDRASRRQRDARLSQGPGDDGPDAPSRRLARDRRSRLPRCRRLLLHHRPAEGAHHQGR
jgi:hypothetical protein